MIDVRQFREYIAHPALLRLAPAIPWSLAGENLVIGTALHESKLTYVDQLAPGPGPAYGVCQMEAPTYTDLWDSFIQFRPQLSTILLNMAGHDELARPPPEEMHGNLFYACAMCRVAYRRFPDALPEAGDAFAMAALWKRRYNTSLGKGTIEQALPSFQRAVAEGS